MKLDVGDLIVVKWTNRADETRLLDIGYVRRRIEPDEVYVEWTNHEKSTQQYYSDKCVKSLVERNVWKIQRKSNGAV